MKNTTTPKEKVKEPVKYYDYYEQFFVNEKIIENLREK